MVGVRSRRSPVGAVLRCTIFALLLSVASPSYAEPPPGPGDSQTATPTGPNPGVKALDLLIVRPASLVQTILGGWVAVVAYPLSYFGGDPDFVLDITLRDPLNYTFRRKLGEF